MSKSLLDKIKNPDVPGFEEILPPPPPPPRFSTNLLYNPKNASIPLTHHNDSASSYCYPQPNQSWMIPNDTDSDLYSQWYESAYKAALYAAQEKDFNGKSKLKNLKKKSEVVDPKLDAEKVANAQKELSLLMKPLKCDLCNAIMNSTLQAKLHYQGKPHQKKVSMFLNQSARKLKIEYGQVSSTTNDWNTYCEMCKIWFTSHIDATQHYSGKKHLKAVFGTNRVKLTKKGLFQNKTAIDPLDQFSICSNFQSEMQIHTTHLISHNPLLLSPVSQYSQPPISYETSLRCDLCGISANHQDQLDTHMQGTKHIKILKLRGLPVQTAETLTASEPVSVNDIDYSIYRTPSGQYYCAPCNLSLSCEITFSQHIESEEHKNQVNLQQDAPSPLIKKAKKK